jgi:hypothetical protein
MPTENNNGNKPTIFSKNSFFVHAYILPSIPGMLNKKFILMFLCCFYLFFCFVCVIFQHLYWHFTMMQIKIQCAFQEATHNLLRFSLMTQTIIT